MSARYETRAEKQAFMARLGRVHFDDRDRLLKEHRDYLNGKRPTDADFDSVRLPYSAPPPLRPPPVGKDASYLLANKRMASAMRHAIAKKTIAGSGKKRLPNRKKAADQLWEPDESDEDYVEEDEVGHDDDYDEDGDFEEAECIEREDTMRKEMKKKAVQSKKAGATPKAAVKKPRKKSSRTLAKEARDAAAAEIKATAAKKRQDQVAKAQQAGKDAKVAARNRLEEAKKAKSEATTRKFEGERAGRRQKKRRTSPHNPVNQSNSDSASSEGSQVGVTPRRVISLTPVNHTSAASTATNVSATPPAAETPHPSESSSPRSASPTVNDELEDYDVLDSDCDEDDDELTFVDEVEVSADPDIPLEIPAEDDSVNASSDNDGDVLDEDKDGGEDDEFSWPELDQDELLAFAQDEAELSKMRKNGWELDPRKFPPDQSYPGLYEGPYGPSEDVLAVADSPLDLFLFFLPRELWKKIAAESTTYHEQNLVDRVERMYNKQKIPGKKSKEEFMEREAKHADIEAHEIVILLGLLIARMINPQRRHFYDHWSTTSVGAVAGGTFGKFLKRNRFMYILANLHFTDNADARAGADRAWKVRSIVDTLQRTFSLGYTVPPVISFDEAIIPLPNKHNPTRQYIANKPHKWGAKLFMTCCAESSYCLRLEVYCGKAQHAQEIGNVPESVRSIDHNSGPAAVMRNLEAVLPPPSHGVFHLIVTDRFYTSVQLAYQLLNRQVYCVGTIQDDRKGFCDAIVEKNRDRPKSVPHGTTRMAVAKNCPILTSLVWWDRRPVLLLGTGGSRTMESCYRWRPGSVRVEVPCPSMMRDYHRWMGGVDVHDQLRLQRYSLQQQTKCKKYYKAIFLGLVDVAIVNAYIVYREAQKNRGARQFTHAEFLTQLQAQMLDLTKEDFDQRQPQVDGVNLVTRSMPAEHVPRENPDYQIVNGQRKRRQRQCKVCSNRKRSVGERRATKYYCPGCSPSEKARTYLCNKVWPHVKNNTLTCHQIWHLQWNNGKDRPRPRCGRDIQNREAGTSAGKRKRKRSLQGGGNSAEDDEDDNAEDVAENTAEDDSDGSAEEAANYSVGCTTEDAPQADAEVVENAAGQDISAEAVEQTA